MNWFAIASAGVVLLVLFVLGAWIGKARRAITLLKMHPDTAYEFFKSHSENWVVFPVRSSALQPDQLPVAHGVLGRKPLGPFEFHVPKLGGRTVSVFGVTRECFQDLDQLNLRIHTQANNTSEGICR